MTAMTTDTDRNKFVDLYVTHQNRIFGFILTLVFDRNEAQDIFQQTSLTLWAKWNEFDHSKDFVKWACGIAFNHIRNHQRSRRQSGEVSLSDDVLESLAQTRMDGETWLNERRDALNRCLKKLPKEKRQIFERCYVGEEAIKDVAVKYDLKPNVLYKLLGRIRRALYQCIDGALSGSLGPAPVEGDTE